MKVWKWVALVAGGGVLLQAGGCAAWLMQNVAQLALDAVIQAILAASTTT